jgi:hypothetical protein
LKRVDDGTNSFETFVLSITKKEGKGKEDSVCEMDAKERKKERKDNNK